MGQKSYSMIVTKISNELMMNLFHPFLCEAKNIIQQAIKVS